MSLNLSRISLRLVHDVDFLLVSKEHLGASQSSERRLAISTDHHGADERVSSALEAIGLNGQRWRCCQTKAQQ